MAADCLLQNRIMLPIRLGIDPMERLLFATFKGDPEFEGFEPQIFDDPINGKGMRVLRYRKDRKIDVYWQRGVRVDRRSFAMCAGIGDFTETTIKPARLEITERCVDMHMAFIDAQGRDIELCIHEDIYGKRGFPLLAPVGADIDRPAQFFMVYFPSIDLVRRSGSKVEGRIGDRILHPASLPILLNWHRVLFIRYAAKPLIGTLNPPMSQPLILEMTMPGSAEADGMTIVADEKGSVTHISTGLKPRNVEMIILPGFPNLLEIPEGASATGRWVIHIAGVNITGGSYCASREGDRVAVELDVTENWKPSVLPFGMEIFTRVLRMFRSWPATY